MKQRILQGLLISILMIGGAASAQEPYPRATTPVRIVVPFAAGGGSDAIMRILSKDLAQRLKTSVVVENKPGANGRIGAEFVAKAPQDGYTLLAGSTSTHSANEFLYKRLTYDPVKDFAPIARVSTNALMLLVNSGSPLRNVQDLLDSARANPGKLTYGYANASGNVVGTKFLNMAKLSAVAVPYKDAPQLMTDLMGGRVEFIFYDIAGTRPLIESNKLRILATSAPKRSSTAPGVPSLSEMKTFENFGFVIWLGLFAPQGTPGPVIDKLNQELRAVLKTREVRERLERDYHLEVSDTSVAEFGRFLAEQRRTWKQLVEESAIVPE